jgi:hypothetical protein
MRIDFDAVQEKALKGIRRSYVFMGLGVNSAEDDRLVNYQLTPVTNLQLLQDGLDKDVVSNFKVNYKEWVINNAFRDALEVFHVFVEDLFICLILIKKRASNIDHIKKEVNRFERLPFPSKMETLKKEFLVEPEFINHIKSINKTRNCMSHRGWVVSVKDYNNSPKSALVLEWRGMNVVLTDQDGERERHMSELIGMVTKHDTQVGLKFVSREKAFTAGQVLSFEPKELAEVLWYWTMEIKRMLRCAIEYAKNSGISFVDSKS